MIGVIRPQFLNYLATFLVGCNRHWNDFFPVRVEPDVRQECLKSLRCRETRNMFRYQVLP